MTRKRNYNEVTEIGTINILQLNRANQLWRVNVGIPFLIIRYSAFHRMHGWETWGRLSECLWTL